MASSIRVIDSFEEAREYSEAGLLWWHRPATELVTETPWHIDEVPCFWLYQNKDMWDRHRIHGLLYGIMVEE